MVSEDVDLDQLEREYDGIASDSQWHQQVLDLIAAYRSLAARLVVAEWMFERYGRHDAACPVRPQTTTGVAGYPMPQPEMGPCDCGFSVALAPGAGTTEEGS